MTTPGHQPSEHATHGETEGQRKAAVLQRANPGWIILFGSYSKKYIAFPLFTVQPGNYVIAPDSQALGQRMRHVEATLAPAPRPPHDGTRSTSQ